MKLYKIIFIALSFLLASCNSYKDIAIDENFKFAKCVVGDTITITLESNATTGYDWIFDDANLQILNLQSQNYLSNNSHICGADGHKRFVFKAVKEGSCLVLLKYKRPWEKDAIKTQIYKIVVCD